MGGQVRRRAVERVLVRWGQAGRLRTGRHRRTATPPARPPRSGRSGSSATLSRTQDELLLDAGHLAVTVSSRSQEALVRSPVTELAEFRHVPPVRATRTNRRTRASAGDGPGVAAMDEGRQVGGLGGFGTGDLGTHLVVVSGPLDAAEHADRGGG